MLVGLYHNRLHRGSRWIFFWVETCLSLDLLYREISICGCRVWIYMSKNQHSKVYSSQDSKVCLVCAREFSWRKKWEKNWEHVLYCSDACRTGRYARAKQQQEKRKKT